jgi:hypothetical protein
VTSHLTADLRKRFERPPLDVQEQARQSYRRWRSNPQHSVRIGLHWRAPALKDAESLDWFWISPHAQYDKLLDQLR